MRHKTALFQRFGIDLHPPLSARSSTRRLRPANCGVRRLPAGAPATGFPLQAVRGMGMGMGIEGLSGIWQASSSCVVACNIVVWYARLPAGAQRGAQRRSHAFPDSALSRCPLRFGP
jgi:hypothetical protein